MKKVDFSVRLSAEQQQETEALIKDLQADPAIAELIERNAIPSRYLTLSPWRLDNWRRKYAPCISCKGLHACGQKEKGYFQDLTYCGTLIEEYTPCRYQKAYLSSVSHQAKYLINDMPVKLYAVFPDQIDLRKESQAYLLAFQSVLDAIEKREGLYLDGTMGSGKTYLAAAAANYFAKAGESTAFIHYPTFCTRAAASMQSKEYVIELNRLMRASFLVIDDIGAESVNEWNRDQLLLPLLEARCTAGLVTWFTSNCDHASLRSHFMYTKGKEDILKASRILERIQSMTRRQTLTGKDRRLSLS